MTSSSCWRNGFLGWAGAVGLTSTLALADPTVVQDPLGPDGDTLGCSLSPKGDHAAALANKGTHYVILYDGAEQLKVDALLYGTGATDLYRAPTYYGGQVPIIFSDDGAHYAYIARVGDDYVVMLDGKELLKAPLRTSPAPGKLPLTFSAKGKHLFYSDSQPGNDSYMVVVDGKSGPATHQLPNVLFSPDGEHYAYVGAYSNQGVGQWSFVDGRQVNYFGELKPYTGHNVLISQVSIPGGGTGLVINGKPAIKAARLDPMWISPDGLQMAVVVTPDQTQPSVLTINGKMVDGTQGLNIEKVYFSPDGKRWAALCNKKTGSKFMIVDGQKGQDYADIPASTASSDNVAHWHAIMDDPNSGDYSAYQLLAPGFTADSSKFVYLAGAAGREFLIVDGNESNGYQGFNFVPILSVVGNRIGVIGTAQNNKQHLLIDGAEINIGAAATSGTGQAMKQLTFSADARHYYFLLGMQLFVDNVAQPGGVIGNYYVSPDSNHFAYSGTVAGRPPALIVDGKAISDTPGMVGRIFFSPDGQHVYWWSTGNWAALGGTRDSMRLFVDGKPTSVHFLAPINGYTIKCSFSADDVLTFVGLTDGNLVRYHVTSDTTLSAVFAAAHVPKG
jgi:hypothetical protein